MLLWFYFYSDRNFIDLWQGKKIECVVPAKICLPLGLFLREASTELIVKAHVYPDSLNERRMRDKWLNVILHSFVQFFLSLYGIISKLTYNSTLEPLVAYVILLCFSFHIKFTLFFYIIRITDSHTTESQHFIHWRICWKIYT